MSAHSPTAHFSRPSSSAPAWLRRACALMARVDKAVNGSTTLTAVFILSAGSGSWLVFAGVGVALALVVGGSELHKHWTRPPAAAAASPAPVWPQGATGRPQWPVPLMRGVISEQRAGTISFVVMTVFLLTSLACPFVAISRGWSVLWGIVALFTGIALTIAALVLGPVALVAASTTLAARRLSKHVGSLPAKLNEDPHLRRAVELYVSQRMGNQLAHVALDIADSFDGTVDELIAASKAALDA